ncbi:MAG: hypothetical protein S4CHLAM6_03010 [Chlamydiae bacterium]|nr:hypothetical protein [Chlamydiota bacterium]
MVDSKGIPPPNFDMGKSLNLGDELMSEDVASFQQYLTKPTENSDDDREQIQEEVTQEEDNLKTAMIHEEMEEASLIEDTEEEGELEEEKNMSEREAELDEKMGEKAAQQRISRMRRKMNEDSEQIDDKDLDDEDIKLIQDNQEINEEGETAASVEDEESSLENLKKEVKSEKDLVSDHIEERDEELAHAGKDKKVDPHKKSERQDFKQETEAKKAPEKKQGSEKTHSQNQSVAANLSESQKSEASQYSKAQKSGKATAKSDLQKQFEALAQELVGEAQVLENGDVLETTITLNLEGSQFDQGEVRLTTHKFRPLEVNLEFKKFGHGATSILKNNSKGLKKVLKENSLTVHQLHIIE